MSYVINKYHGSYNRSWRTSSIQYLCIHYVGAGTSAAGNARNNCIYFSNGNRNASADYFIDDGGIWEYNDPSEGYCCWAVGDGGGAYGITNQNSISIEVCMNGDQPFTNAEIDYLTWLTQHLMAKYNIPASRVVRHYDASRKSCPLYYVTHPAKWTKLHAQITGGSVNGDASGGSSSNALVIDGYWGSATTLALQNALNAPYKDGVISYQHYSNKQYLAACVSGWEFGSSTAGSQTIKLLQQKLGVTADGLFGPESIAALQKRMGTYVDGRLDAPSPCVMEMQRRLNAGTF